MKKIYMECYGALLILFIVILFIPMTLISLTLNAMRLIMEFYKDAIEEHIG